MVITKSVTRIPLGAANESKLAALNALAAEYMALCQTYVTHFCLIAPPDGYADLMYDSSLSKRWQRVAVMQAAGIAQSWRTNRRQATAEYLDRLAWYDGQPDAKKATRQRPIWHEWKVPTLCQTCIQANVNVLAHVAEPPERALLRLEPAETARAFDGWLRIAVLEQGKPLYLPLKLADYHRQMLAGQTPNSSMQLNCITGRWWLTLSFDESVKPYPTTGKTALDIGMSNWLTDSAGRRYGGFDKRLVSRHERDCAKRQRKAKLRACLEKKGVSGLPSTMSASGERQIRHIKQNINRAVNEYFEAHPHDGVVMEALSISALRFKARFMNARLRAALLGHIPRQVAWGAAKRGLPICHVNPAYSSQQCQRCHFVARENRPDQQTFCCQACGFRAHADVNASRNLLHRADDPELARCTSLSAVKTLLLARHAQWRAVHGCP